MSDEKRYDELDAYLKGNMSATDKAQFEARLEVDSVLNEELKLLKSSREVMEFDYMMDLKANLESLAIEHKTAQNKKWWLLGGLAGLFILSGTTFFFYPKEESPSQNVSLDQSNDQNLGGDVVQIVKEISSNEPKHIKDQPTIQHSDDHVNLAPINTNPVQREHDVFKEEAVAFIEKQPEELQAVKEEPPTMDQQVFEEEVVVESSNEVSAKTPCVRPKVSILSYGASADADNGSIVVNNQSDQELAYKLIETEEEYTQFNEIQDLKSGDYTLLAINDARCEFELGHVTIPRLPCLKERDHAFNRNYDHEWPIPTGQDTDDGHVQIIGQRGIPLYEADFQSGEELFWNGVDIQGAEMALGVYKVIISYNDGKTCLYNVVIEE